MMFVYKSMKKFIGSLALIVFMLLTGCNESSNNEQSGIQDTNEINPALLIAVEDLNNVLPQRQGASTYFDSVGVEPNHLYYYYTIENLSFDTFVENELSDSLYSASVERIPCSLWRPVYMQGVQVTFTYHSNDQQELLQFTRFQDECHI